MYRAFPGSEYYGGSAPPRTDQLSVRPAPPTRWTRTARARSGTVPVFTVLRSTKEEPDYAPAASLRVRRRLSSQPPWRLMPTAAGVPHPTSDGCAPLPAHVHQVSGWRLIKGMSHAGSSRTPLRHACRTQTIWQCWPVPALSGLLPPSPAPPGSGCPQLHRPAATRSAAKVSHLHSKHSASRRTLSRPGARCRYCCRSVSPGRSPNPPCQFPGNGLSTVSAVRRGSRVAMGLGSCSPGRRSG